MTTQHFCDKAKGENKWAEGPVIACKLHGHDGRKQLGYREGRKDRAKRDRQAGRIGVDRGYDPGGGGGYISG